MNILLKCVAVVQFRFFLFSLKAAQHKPEETLKAERLMEELMPELVALMLNQVDHHSLIACRFVCTTWMHTSPPPQQ
jgi:hypothetical protein